MLNDPRAFAGRRFGKGESKLKLFSVIFKGWFLQHRKHFHVTFFAWSIFPTILSLVKHSRFWALRDANILLRWRCLWCWVVQDGISLRQKFVCLTEFLPNSAHLRCLQCLHRFHIDRYEQKSSLDASWMILYSSRKCFRTAKYVWWVPLLLWIESTLWWYFSCKSCNFILWLYFYYNFVEIAWVYSKKFDVNITNAEWSQIWIHLKSKVSLWRIFSSGVEESGKISPSWFIKKCESAALCYWTGFWLPQKGH